MENNERILFRESDHVYYHEKVVEGKQERERYTSVTTLLNGLQPKKDFRKIALEYLEKRNYDAMLVMDDILKKNKRLTVSDYMEAWGDLEMTVDNLMKIWEDLKDSAADRGTEYHAMKEKQAYERGAKELQTDGDFKVGYNLRNLSGEYSELIVYHPFYKVCGSIDGAAFDNSLTFNLLDFKTNKEKPKKNGFKGERLLTPVSHLENSKLNLYYLQLSIYAFILEEYGYKCTGLKIIYVKDVLKDIVEEMEVPYLKKEAKAILTYFKNRNYVL